MLFGFAADRKEIRRMALLIRVRCDPPANRKETDLPRPQLNARLRVFGKLKEKKNDLSVNWRG